MLKLMRGVFLGAIVLLAFGVAPARSQEADPARWGLYARLAGVERQSGPDGYRLRWRWVKPNEELAEDYILPRTGKVASTNIITPGDQPGTLLVTGSLGAGTKYWDGKVLPDGSVDFIGRGFIKMPYRAVLLDDGSYELRGLILSKGVVQSARAANARDHYIPVNGTPEPPALAPSPETVWAAVPATPAAPATPVTAPVYDFGFLEGFVGRSLVSDTHTLDIYREGNALALHLGDAGGSRLRRFLVSRDSPTGAYLLSETTFPTPPESRLAYFDASGDLYLEYTGDLYRFQTRFRADGDSLLWETRFAEKRRFGGYRAYDPWHSIAYRPSTADALRLAALRNAGEKQREEREEQEARELKRERDAEQSARMNAAYQGLQQALADATAREQQSRAALDATLQQAARQAAYEREREAQRLQQQADASAADDARRAREATERQYEAARQFEAQQQAQQLARQKSLQEAQQVAALRPATTPSAATGSTLSVQACPKVYKSGIGASGPANTQAEAERWARRDMELQCPMANYSAGAMQCAQQSQGDVVSIDSKGRSTRTGERTAWMCQAEFRCNQPSDQCVKGPARGSAQ